MFCSHCGKEVTVGAKFCPNCGAAINCQPTPAAEPPKTPPPTAQREVPAVEQVGNPSGNGTENGGQPKKKKGVPKKPLIIVAAVLVLFVGFGAVLSLFEGGSEPDSGLEGSNGPDWIEKIPIVDVRRDHASESELSPKIPAQSYAEYKERVDVTFSILGMPSNDGISYYEAENMIMGYHNGDTVYFLTNGTTSIAVESDYSGTEPLIAKFPGQNIYCLFYKGNDGYIVWVSEPSDPSALYLNWTVNWLIEVTDKEYCSFLNGEQELEVISIPGESGSNSGDLGTAGEKLDYSQYAGTWASDDVGWIYGGQILDIAISGDIMTATFEHIASAPTSQLAEVSVTIPLSEISNGTATDTFDNDGWGQTGTITLTFTEGSIVCDIKDVMGGDPYSTWGILEDTYLLVRDDGAHEKMKYDMDTYYEMFPEDSPQQTPTVSTTASSILDDLGIPDVESFREGCTEVIAGDLFTISLQPTEYIERHFYVHFNAGVTDKAVTEEGYPAYEIASYNREYDNNFVPPMVLIDYRDDVYTHAIDVGDQIYFYGIFKGRYSQDGHDYLLFYMIDGASYTDYS